MKNFVKKFLHSNSIMKRLLPPILAVVVLQSLLFYGTIVFGGAINQLNQNSFDILGERVLGRKNYLQNEMIQRWSNLNDCAVNVNSAAQRICEREAITYSELSKDSELTFELLSGVSDTVINVMRRNMVTGIYVILDNDAGTGDGLTARRGMYLRNPDPYSNAEDNSDLMALRAPSALTKQLNIPMATDWTAQFVFPQGQEAYFSKPFEAARQYPDLEIRDLGYWCPSFDVTGEGLMAIMYSVPLRDGSGVPFGVLGVEISLDYLHNIIPYSELQADKKGSYLLAVGSEDSSELQNVLTTGPTATQLVGERPTTVLEKSPEHKNMYTMQQSERVNQTVYAYMEQLDLYNSNTPFSADRWKLVGMVEEDVLLAFSGHVKTTLLFALLFSLLLGIFSAVLMARGLASPIAGLAKKVRASDPSKPVSLDKINVAEIDELSLAVENLSRDVAESASRLSQVIQLAGITIGAFDLRREEKQVFCTTNFFQVLGMGQVQMENYVSMDLFQKSMLQFHRSNSCDQESKHSYLYSIKNSSGGQPRWVRLKLVENKIRTLGVATDVTAEIQEKRKIEYERDYDLLTNLLNRRAFQEKLKALFNTPAALKKAALVMLDLDNLKYINDTYGHDYGDEYIRCAAAALRKFIPYQVVVARMSGDEFHMFIHGYDTEEEILELIRKIKTEIGQTVLPLPGDQTGFRVRASAGVAWYPKDSLSFSELIKFADFAMYEVKNTVKGEFSNFNLESYSRDSYLLHSKEELNRLIDGELIEYHFQPIVDVRTGKVFAYEALMRSRSKTLSSPVEVLTLARSQSKLGQIERLTWFKALGAFAECHEVPRPCKVFINSIPNQILSIEDLHKIEVIFADYLNRIVLELTEEEKLDAAFTYRKKEYIRRWKGQLAMDDFGTGYNGDVTLLELTPDYVKIDMSIVRGIDTDKSRQQIFRNLVSYTRERKIKIIAEGVETAGEMEAVIACGADYIQGYYLGRPAAVPQIALPEELQQALYTACYKAGVV